MKISYNLYIRLAMNQGPFSLVTLSNGIESSSRNCNASRKGAWCSLIQL